MSEIGKPRPPYRAPVTIEFDFHTSAPADAPASALERARTYFGVIGHVAIRLGRGEVATMSQSGQERIWVFHVEATYPPQAATS